MSAEFAGAVAAGRPDPNTKALAQRLMALRAEIDAILAELAGPAEVEAGGQPAITVEPSTASRGPTAVADMDRGAEDFSSLEGCSIDGDGSAVCEPDGWEISAPAKLELALSEIEPAELSSPADALNDAIGEEIPETLEAMTPSATADAAAQPIALATDTAEPAPAESVSLEQPMQDAVALAADAPSAPATEARADTPVISLDAHREAMAAARRVHGSVRRRFMTRVAAVILALLLGASLVIVQRTFFPSAYALSWVMPAAGSVGDATAHGGAPPSLGQGRSQLQSSPLNQGGPGGGLLSIEGFLMPELMPAGS